MNTKIAKDITGELINITDVKVSQTYYCVDCGKALIKKNKNPDNRKRIIHFAHSTNCSGNLETYLHKISKDIIEKEKKILLPQLGNFSFALCEKECRRFEGIVPDILIGNENGIKAIIEIYVRHITDELKIKKIKGFGIPAFEIDLSALSYDSDFETIRHELIENLSNRKTLHFPVIKSSVDKPTQSQQLQQSRGNQSLWSTVKDTAIKYVPLEDVTNEVLEFYDHYKFYFDDAGLSKEGFLKSIEGSQSYKNKTSQWKDFKKKIDEINDLTVFAFRSNSGKGSGILVLCVTKENLNFITFSNTYKADALFTNSSDRKKFASWFKTLLD